MRRFMAAGVVLAAALLAGCRTRSFQVSVHPFFHTIEAPGDVAGRWVGEEEEEIGLELVPSGQNEWRVAGFDAKSGAKEHNDGDAEANGVVVRFGRVGEALFWDLTAECGACTDDMAKEHLLKLHSVARVRLDGDTMEIAFLNPEWMTKALADGRVDLAHFAEGLDEGDILTARTKDLEGFLEAHGDDQEAFDMRLLFHRVH